MGRLIKSAKDCADCLCRVCANNDCNDSWNHALDARCGYKKCTCNCSPGDEITETLEDCPEFLPDEL